MRITICDRCKQQIKHPNIDGIGTIRIEVKGERGTVMKENPWKDWDLCPSCVADIKEYVEAPTREEEEKPKAVIRKKKRSVKDQVREIAAADPDLKPKEIAAQIGCNVQSVYNYLKEAPSEETEPAAEGDETD